MTLGAIALTRIPFPASSPEAALVRPITPAFAAEYAASPPLDASQPAADAMFTIAPFPWLIMCGKTARIVQKVPLRQTFITRSQVSSLSSQIGSSLLIPALLNSTSIRPNFSIVFATASSICFRSVTSTTTPSTSRLNCLLSSSASSPVRRGCASVIAIFAPSSRKRVATAWPIPAPAPAVINATLSCSSTLSSGIDTDVRESFADLGHSHQDRHFIFYRYFILGRLVQY